MEQWLQFSLLLCSFGFFREFRPSESFAPEFVVNSWRNLTEEEIYKDLYPIRYSTMLVQIIIIILFTDIWRYKPFLVISALAGIVLFSLLIWARNMVLVQISQVFYGLYMGPEISYLSYIYAKVQRIHYQSVTGHTRAALLGGDFCGAVLTYLLVSKQNFEFYTLNYISVFNQVVSLFIAFALPKAPMSVYFYATPSERMQYLRELESSNILLSDRQEPIMPRFSMGRACRVIRMHFKDAYTNPVIVQWSIWWTLASCGHIQVNSYVLFLWNEIATNRTVANNCAVEATTTLVGAICALSGGWANSDKHRNTSMCIICGCTAFLGLLLHISSWTDSIWIAYINYVFFNATFFFSITVASAIIAINLTEDSYGLVFGINTFVASIVQMLLTIILVANAGLGLGPRAQFIAYAIYYYVLSVFYFFVVCFRCLC